MKLIQSDIKTMTLKEITDLLDVRHDKAMIKVGKMSSDPEFGALSKMDIVYNTQGQTVESYILDKRQSMAVAAVLNTALLMRVIDRWQELESAVQQPAALPGNYIEALQALIESEQGKAAAQEQLAIAAPKVEFVDKLVERDNLMTATQVGQKHKMSAIKLNRFLDELGGVYSKKVKRSRTFLQSFIDKGYGELKQNDSGHDQPLFTNKGEVWIGEQIHIDNGRS